VSAVPTVSIAPTSATARSTSAPTSSIPFYCLHAKSWLLTSKNYVAPSRSDDDEDLYRTPTDVVSSYAQGSYWKIKSYQIPYYSFNVTGQMISQLSSRPYKTPSLREGQRCKLGQDLGFDSDSCGLGFWPYGNSICPYSSTAYIQFPLFPAPEISSGRLSAPFLLVI
jgi:hypothetical protein